MLLGPGPLDFAGKPTVPLADYSGPNPTGVPASLRGADIIARGRYLAAAADCGACHTIRGQPEYSGGLAFNLPFGTLYAPNITPEKETGIGAWSDADFLRALHQGIA